MQTFRIFHTLSFKLLIIALFMNAGFILTSCNKDEIRDLNNKVTLLQDSLQYQNSFLLDSLRQSNERYYNLLDSLNNLQLSIAEYGTKDIKAMKMLQIGSLFENAARQPEKANDLIKITQLMVYGNIEELLPIMDKSIDQRGEARGSSFSQLFSAIARNPEIAPKLDSAAEQFLGAYNPEIISDELLEVTKTYAIPGLYEAMARNPGLDSIYNSFSVKYLNTDILN